MSTIIKQSHTGLGKAIPALEATSSHGFSGSPLRDIPPTPGHSVKREKKSFLRIRGKMLVLFCLVPVILFAVAGYLFDTQLRYLAHDIHDQGNGIVTNLAEGVVVEKAKAVARQVGLYLDTHRDLMPEHYTEIPELMELGIQKIGTSGYTIVNREPVDGNPWYNVIGPNPDYLWKDMDPMMREMLGAESYAKVRAIQERALATREISTGYYRFLEGKDKFQAMAPVEGTPYWVLATTFLDDFTAPMDSLAAKTQLITVRSWYNVLMGLTVIAVLIIVLTVFFGNRLSGKIVTLTQVADRISMGDMDVEVPGKGSDELADLSDAISRMQASIRLSLSRLRKRRR